MAPSMLEATCYEVAGGIATITIDRPERLNAWTTTTNAELAYDSGVPKPVLAAINGSVAGIGFALSWYCGLRFAARGAKSTTAQGRLGLPCAFGLAWLLPRLVGLPRALDLLLSSRTFGADEALLDPMMAGPDYREGVAALREKRPPVFGDPSAGT